jgi:hypothetical protein
MHELGADPVKTLVGIILFFVLMGAMMSYNENMTVVVYNCKSTETDRSWGPLWPHEMNNLKAGLDVECEPLQVPRKSVWTMRNR